MKFFSLNLAINGLIGLTMPDSDHDCSESHYFTLCANPFHIECESAFEKLQISFYARIALAQTSITSFSKFQFMREPTPTVNFEGIVYLKIPNLCKVQ